MNDDNDLVNGGDLYCTGSYCPTGNNYIKVSSCGYNNFIALDTNGTAILWSDVDNSASFETVLTPNYNFTDIYNSIYGCTLIRTDGSAAYISSKANKGGSSSSFADGNFEEIIADYFGFLGMNSNIPTYWGTSTNFNGVPSVFPNYKQLVTTGVFYYYIKRERDKVKPTTESYGKITALLNITNYQSSLSILRNDGYIEIYSKPGEPILGPDQNISVLTPYTKPNL